MQKDSAPHSFTTETWQKQFLCKQCNRCCSGPNAIVFSAAEKQKFDRDFPQIRPQYQLLRIAQKNAYQIVLTSSDQKCPFLKDGGCIQHRQFGFDYKSECCKKFPFNPISALQNAEVARPSLLCPSIRKDVTEERFPVLPLAPAIELNQAIFLRPNKKISEAEYQQFIQFTQYLIKLAPTSNADLPKWWAALVLLPFCWEEGLVKINHSDDIAPRAAHYLQVVQDLRQDLPQVSKFYSKLYLLGFLKLDILGRWPVLRGQFWKNAFYWWRGRGLWRDDLLEVVWSLRREPETEANFAKRISFLKNFLQMKINYHSLLHPLWSLQTQWLMMLGWSNVAWQKSQWYCDSSAGADKTSADWFQMLVGQYDQVWGEGQAQDQPIWKSRLIENLYNRHRVWSVIAEWV